MKNAIIVLIIAAATILSVGYLLAQRHEKSLLKSKFEEDFIRFVPMDIFTTKSLNGYDVLYQKPETYSNRYNYPNHYVVGVKNGQWLGYDYAFTLTQIDFFKDEDYITALVAHFKSDSTRVSSIWMRNGNIQFTVKRKYLGAYWPWRIYSSPYLQMQFKEESSLNDHLWKPN